MAKEVEIKGIWWLPSNQNQKIPGALKFSNEVGIRLELHGSFSTARPNEVLIGEIIHGRSYQGNPITLYDWFSTSNTPPSVIVSNNLFIGKHFNRAEDIKFSSMRIGFEHLEEWIGGGRFEVMTKRRVFKHTPPQTMSLRLPSIKARLLLGYELSAENDIRSIRLDHADYLELRPATPQSYQWFTDKLYALHVFLVLMVGNAINPTFVMGIGNVTHKVGRRSLHEEIKIYRPRSDAHSGAPNWRLLAFRLPDLRNSIQTHLDKWFRDFDVLAPVYDLLWPIVAPQSTYSEAIFLNLTQAIETFHRRTCKGLYLTKDDYKPVREILTKAIPAGLPVGLRDRLKSQIKYGNEISFRSRLTDVLNGPLWNNCLSLFIKDRDIFIASVVDTRNYYVHYDQSLEAKALKPLSGLYHCNELLLLTLFVLLYNHLGIPIDKIVEGVRRNDRFRGYLLDHRAHYFQDGLRALSF